MRDEDQGRLKGAKKKKTIPFDFILDELAEMDIFVRPMFGCYALYQSDKIVLIVRNKEDHQDDNGVWLATTIEHHASLKKDFPHMRSIRVFETPVTSWQNLPSEAPDFEEAVLKACDLIRNHDPRIGKIPNSRKKKSRSRQKGRRRGKKR